MQALRQALWAETPIFAGFDAAEVEADLQGWNVHHPYLRQVVEEIRPDLLVEVGVWKGASLLHMAEVVREHGLPTALLAVDTWLGGWDHWELPEWFGSLRMQNGFPRLYYTFLGNVLRAEADDVVTPLPLDSINAATLLRRKGLAADVVHVDGGHDYASVASDLRAWWPVLRPGGVMIADDYDATGAVWWAVRDAVNDFLAETAHEDFRAEPYKCRFTKPA